MTTKLKWRLGKLPSPDEVALLKKEGIISKEEAHEILFSQETEEDRDKKSLQDEIKFLRTLVQSLASAQTIATHIYTLPNEKMPWAQQPWYPQYTAFCSSADNQQQLQNNAYGLIGGVSGSNVANMTYTTTQANALYAYDTSATPDFTDIKTF